MIIKILKGENLFDDNGLHICDKNGFALVANEDCEIDVTHRVEIVNQILKDSRALRGLDENGVPFPPEPQPEAILPTEEELAAMAAQQLATQQLKESAKTKLKALGLTDAEIAAIIGV